MPGVEPTGALARDAPLTPGTPSGRSEAARGGARRSSRIRTASTILLVLGLAVLSDVAGTLIWQEPLSSIWARLQQDSLAGQVASVESTTPSPVEAQALGHLHTNAQRIALLARELKHTARIGSGVGRIGIPSLGVSYLLVNGTDTAALVKGPGIYPQTPFPGAPGTTAVAGHRTTFLAPFRNIDRLRPGQTIRVQMPYGDFSYAVTKTRIVDPTDFSVIAPVGYQQLVLSACDPPFSAAKRIIVFARLVHRRVRGRAFPQAAAAVAPLEPTGPGVLVLSLLAVGVLVVIPLAVYAVGAGLVRRLRRR
jgi:sortase A